MTNQRNWVLAAMILLTGVVSASAGKKAPTGVVDANLYRDNLYGFTFQGYENWKFSGIKKEEAKKPKRLRFNLVQKNYQIPTKRRDNQEEYTPPGLGLWVDTTSLPVDSFAMEIANPKSKHRGRKELTRAFPDLRLGKYVEQSPIQIDGADGVMQQYRVDYETQLYNRLRDKYTLIEDFRLGDLYIVKRGDRIFAFYFQAERLNYRTVKEEAKKMILSMDFDPPADSTAADGD